MKKGYTRKLTVTAIMAALAALLMYFPKITLPFMPPFITLDFSDLPALLASFSMGPLSGLTVCLIKNLVSLLGSMTGGVGEISNFLISAAFVVPAGLIYKYRHDRIGALVGSLSGAVIAALLSVATNYYIVYPVYDASVMPMNVILGMYRAINPNVETLWDALLWFNMPFTFCKELISVVVTFLIYKRISPLLKGKK